ncbi:MULTISPECIES: hypothetical protein [unclassified Streptomyces]|uniref:hypothetical protein n=1 Tax=unclassified Streptomyces TaxID=2593676 RepID=UPI0037013FC4
MRQTQPPPGLPKNVSQTLHCAYHDSTTQSIDQLGQLHASALAAQPQQTATGALLHTCHRIEWYSAGPVDGDTPTLAGAQTLTGYRPVVDRIAQIAAGCRSLIPGDRFVQGQVASVFEALPDEHPLRDAADSALALARQARTRFTLVADVDYPQLAGLLLTQQHAGDADRGLPLLIIGGGSLARACARSLGAQRRVIMVTRQPKRLRRSLRYSGTCPQVVTVAQAVEATNGHSFEAILATTLGHAAHHDTVLKLLSADGCRAVVDLCTVPLRLERPGYTHLHAPQVLDTIARANQRTAVRAAQAARWISAQTAELAARQSLHARL